MGVREEGAKDDIWTYRRDGDISLEKLQHEEFQCMYSLQILLGVFNKIARACGMYTFRPALRPLRLPFHGFFPGSKAAEVSS